LEVGRGTGARLGDDDNKNEVGGGGTFELLARARAQLLLSGRADSTGPSFQRLPVESEVVQLEVNLCGGRARSLANLAVDHLEMSNQD